MEITLACQHTVAEQTRALQDPALGEIRLVGDEYLLDPARVVQQVGVLMNQAKPCNTGRTIARRPSPETREIPEVSLRTTRVRVRRSVQGRVLKLRH